MLTDRLRRLAEELSRHDPESANRLVTARTEEEFLTSICRLFNLSLALAHTDDSSRDRNKSPGEIAQFITSNLHKGMTLKILAQFLGCSEKYCSALFYSMMGESFSRYLKRQRIDTAVTLLKHTDKPISDIASTLGFSDQFSFSHFFKRATGRSPRDIRADRARPHPRRISVRTSRKPE
jgi:AraC-like DNA-binding protein